MAWGREISRAAVAAVSLTILAFPSLASAAGPPQIGAASVTGVTATGANLRAELNPNGLSTGYRFEYITEAAYRANLDAAPPREGFAGAAKVPAAGEAGAGLGSVPQEVSQHVGGLSPATAYLYRVVAKNSAGTEVGLERHLVTKAFTASVGLPDGRAWEMVSPVEKGGGAIGAPESLYGGGDFQAAELAPAVTYGSASAFGGAVGAPPSSQYVSRISGPGWSTANVSPPVDSGAYGDQPDGAPFRVFSEDLSHALLFGGLACRGGLSACSAPTPPLPGSGAPPGYMAYYLRDASSGAFSSLLGAADVAHSAVSPKRFEVSFAGASPDLSHIVLSSCARLTADAVEVPAGTGRCDEAAPNLYEWSAGGLRAVNLKPGDPAATPGAELAAPIGAISDNGSRVYWTAAGSLYLREGTQTVTVDASGGAELQTATPDGSLAFFTTADGHLHRFAAATQSSSDLTPGGEVVGVLGASPDGEYVYFQDSAGLEQWHSGTTTRVAPGLSATAPSDYLPATATARLSADGAHLAFLSTAELTGYDNTDAATFVPDTELFVYGPPPGGGAPGLLCASCNPTGERPIGGASIPGAQANGSTRAYRPRSLSAGGSRLFFDSGDSLATRDTNKARDVYEWEASGVGGCGRSQGCVSLISSGRSLGGARFVDASADGANVFFLTEESLVGVDPGSIDLYDARIGGGFPEALKPIACIGDACQSLPAEPEDPTPGTLTPSSGNPARHFVREKPRRRKHRHRPRRHRGHRGKVRGR